MESKVCSPYSCQCYTTLYCLLTSVVPFCQSSAASDVKMDERYEEAAQQLAKEAVHKLSADNVTVILVRIS